MTDPNTASTDPVPDAAPDAESASELANATAMPGPLAAASPTPRNTASAPTRPMWAAYFEADD